jgi:hypothetical protein
MVIGLVLVAAVAMYSLGYFSPQEPVGTQTWQQWGMSIQYPAGLKAQYDGIWEQEATNDSGMVFWVWHQGRTELALSWYTVGNLTVDPADVFESIDEEYQGTYDNCTRLDGGNTTIAGRAWQYMTWQVTDKGVTLYVTFTLAHYQPPGRVYMLAFTDSSPGTLASLRQYGDTFAG